MIISIFSLFVCTVIEHWSCCPVSYRFPDSLMLRVTVNFFPLEKQVGLMGEHRKLYSPENQENADWKDLQPSSFTWYKVSKFSGVKRVSCVPINSICSQELPQSRSQVATSILCPKSRQSLHNWLWQAHEQVARLQSNDRELVIGS